MRHLLYAATLSLALLLFAGAPRAQQNLLDEADALYRQIDQLYEQGRFVEAIPLAERALAIREKALGHEHPDIALSLNNLAVLFENQGRYGKAEPLQRRSLAIWEKLLGPEHPDVARSLNNLAVLLQALGRYGEAESLQRRSLAIREKALGPEHLDVAVALNNLARLFETQGRYGEAEPLYRRSLVIREKTLGPEHPDFATALNNLAGLLKAQGRYGEAEPLYRRSLAIRQKALGPEHPDVATALNNLALLFAEQGRYREAEPLYRRSLAIQEKTLGPVHPDVALSLNNLASLFAEQGRYGEAALLYRRSLAIWGEGLGPEHPDVALSLNNLASLFRAQGRYGEAEPLYHRSLAIREKALGPEHPSVATSLNSLAVLFIEQGRYGEAEQLHRRALAIREKILGPEHGDVAVSLNNLAGLFVAQRRYDEAEPLFRRSLAIWGKALGVEHPTVATSFNNLAELFSAQGRYGEAESLYRLSLAIREKALGPEHPDVAKGASNLAYVYEREGRIDQALLLARRATAILHAREAGREDSADAAPALGARRERTYLITHLSIVKRVASANPSEAPTLAGEAFEVAQLASTSSAGQALARTAVRYATGNATLAGLARERQDAADRRAALDKALIAAFAKPPVERDAGQEQRLRTEIEALGKKLGEIDARLRHEFPRFAELSRPAPLALKEAQALLGANEALLAFVVADGATFRFVVRRDKAEFTRIEVKKDELDKLVAAVRAGVEPKEGQLQRFDAASSHQLYETLVGSATPLLAGASRLLVVPDGPLAGLPFSVLVAKKPAEGSTDYRRVDWLMRQYAISLLPTIGSLKALRMLAQTQGKAPQPFSGFGDPVLQGRPGDARRRAVAQLAARGAVADVALVRQMEPLPESAGELNKLAKALGAGGTDVFVRTQATERRVKQLDLSKYRVLAFATHAIMAGEFKGYGEPALVLTPPDKGDDVDDGLLGASEVAALKLNADWVVLSACNTAAPDGTPGAEGLSGLARAFFYAGSRALLVSHWPVLSDAAVSLTTGAFDALAKEPGIGRAEALRRSMLALLDDGSLPPEYAHPTVWAPFSLVGEGGAGR